MPTASLQAELDLELLESSQWPEASLAASLPLNSQGGQARDFLPPMSFRLTTSMQFSSHWVPPASGEIWFAVRQGTVPVGGNPALATAPAIYHGHVLLNGWGCRSEFRWPVPCFPVVQQRNRRALGAAGTKIQRERPEWLESHRKPSSKDQAEPSFPGPTCPTQTWLCLHLCGERGFSHPGMARILNSYLWLNRNTFV